MNNKIYDLLKNKISTYKSKISQTNSSDIAMFGIFNDLFSSIKDDDELRKETGIELITVLHNNNITNTIDILSHSWGSEGVTFILKLPFDTETLYSLNFKQFRDGDYMKYYIRLTNNKESVYGSEFIYKYLENCAIMKSKLKGSYFSMPRNSFSWDIKDIEDRTFGDIFLPSDILEDLHLYVDIFKESEKILRYLKVGNPGVGKTEATLVLASELNKLGVTVIKTNICDKLHNKVLLANVLAPSLIIFDDIDLSLGDRNKGAYSSLLGDFLDVLDGTDKLNDDVGIIATTNAAHLLDLAAQRPGRFDKILLFDDITKDNVKNIILKSLNNNFNISSGELIDIYANDVVVDCFYDAGVSGSHVYNTIKMLKLRYDTLNNSEITVKRIVNSIEYELGVISKIRKISTVKEKLDRSSGEVGFDTNSSNKIGLM